MAIQTRYNGNSKGVTYVDMGKIISNGIAKQLTAYKISGGADLAAEMGVGGAVEAIIRSVQVAASTLMYQVDGSQLSILVEASGWASDADLAAALHALGNRAADAAVPVTAYDFTALTVDSSAGFKLA